MSERERLILEKLAQILPYMPESMKERLMGYGDCMADMLRQGGPPATDMQSGAARPVT